MTQLPTWHPTASNTSLRARAELLWAIRSFFHTREILEVQTPILSRDTVIDRHIDPVILDGSALQIGELANSRFFLQTSPEFGMKRLLAAGMEYIYQISPVFRAGERGTHHNPEFTMVEWYKVGDTLEQAIDLLASLVRTVLNCEPPQIETYQATFLRTVNCDPLECSIEDLIEVARLGELGVDQSWSTDRDAWLDLIFSEMIQPKLGHSTPTIITHYPASQSALAKVCEQDNRTAERFELFIQGIELANGYHELLDANELMSRNAMVTQQRQLDGKFQLPAHSRLIDAMQAGLPACSGCALGLDRLTMVTIGAKSIDQVIPFPIERA